MIWQWRWSFTTRGNAGLQLPKKPRPMSEPPEGHEIPNPIRRRCVVSQYVDAAVVCTNLVKDILRAIPLVQYLLDQVLAFLQPKAHGSLVCLSPRVALHLHPHVPCILAQMSVTWNCR